MVLLPLIKLAEFVNPFTISPWEFKRPIHKDEVTSAIENKDFYFKHTEIGDCHRMTRKQHIFRIAYLTVNVSNVPVEIDVGVPELGFWPTDIMLDGHHRVAAALMRGDTTIAANVSGSLDYAKQIFGVDCSNND